MFNRITDALPGDAANGVSEQSHQAAQAAMQQLSDVRDKAEQFIVRYPLVCLGAAVTAGVLVGWLVKRR